MYITSTDDVLTCKLLHSCKFHRDRSPLFSCITNRVERSERYSLLCKDFIQGKKLSENLKTIGIQ